MTRRLRPADPPSCRSSRPSTPSPVTTPMGAGAFSSATTVPSGDPLLSALACSATERSTLSAAPCHVVNAPGHGSIARTWLWSCAAERVKSSAPSAFSSFRLWVARLSSCGTAAMRPSAHAGRMLASSSPPRSNRRAVRAPAVSSSGITCSSCATTGPVSVPSSSSMMLTPVTASPCRMASATGEGPRWRGSSEGWTFRHPWGATFSSSRWQDAAVGRDNHRVGREGGELLGNLRRAHRRGLEDGDAVLAGPNGRWRRGQAPAATSGAVRLRDHRRDLITCAKEG